MALARRLKCQLPVRRCVHHVSAEGAEGLRAIWVEHPEAHLHAQQVARRALPQAVAHGAGRKRVLKVLAEELGMRFVELKNLTIDRELLLEFPTTAIFRHSLLPLERSNGCVEVATSDPYDLE